jgi:hypothetical protein
MRSRKWDARASGAAANISRKPPFYWKFLALELLR